MSEKMEREGTSFWADAWSKVEPQNKIFFNCGASAPVLVLDKDGMIYKGQRIEDAGEAHRVFLETMALLKERVK
jgi:hypothetical protein